METGNEETTLDLNQVMVEGMDQFQGELEEAAREPKDEPITPKPTDDASPPEDQTVEDGEQAGPGEDPPPDPAPEPAPAGTEAGDTPEGDKEFRFKSHEEAEHGYRHIHAKATRAEQEAERLRAKLKEAREAEAAREAQAEKDRNLLDFMTEEHEKALDSIDALDPDDDNYRKQVARIWAKKDAAVEVRKREQYEVAEPATEPPAETKAPTGPEVWDRVKTRAQAEGIDPDDDYFQMTCAYAPTEGPDGAPLGFEDQVAWAVRQTKDYHAKQERLFQDRQRQAAEKKSETHQAENLPLGRSPADRTALAPDKSPVVTLNDALEGALEERRL